MPPIPVSVIIVTKMPGAKLPRCLDALTAFDDIMIVDSNSADETQKISQRYGVPYHNYIWDGHYPKKRQYCLDRFATKYEWIFFVDTDEIVTPELASEIRQVLQEPVHDAYFIKGQPIFSNTILNFGRWNNKITLFRKSAVHYPVIDDLDLPMGEIEGHYQPLVSGTIGQLDAPLFHDCEDGHEIRHDKYAQWQAGIELRGVDVSQTEKTVRRMAKKVFNATILRPFMAFIDCYIFRLGVLDGVSGFRYARARYRYYAHIACLKRAASRTLSAKPVATIAPDYRA